MTATQHPAALQDTHDGVQVEFIIILNHPNPRDITDRMVARALSTSPHFEVNDVDIDDEYGQDEILACVEALFHETVTWPTIQVAVGGDGLEAEVRRTLPCVTSFELHWWGK